MQLPAADEDQCGDDVRVSIKLFPSKCINFLTRWGTASLSRTTRYTVIPRAPASKPHKRSLSDRSMNIIFVVFNVKWGAGRCDVFFVCTPHTATPTQTACQTTPRSLILKISNKFIPKCRETLITLTQRFSNFFQVGTTFISQNALRTTLLLGLSNSLGLP